MIQELLNLNIFAFFLIFSRIGMAMMLFPGFGAPQVNTRVRLMFAMAISFLVLPVLIGQMPKLPATTDALIALLVGEAVIGAFLGTVARLLMIVLQTAGTLVAYYASLANALISDPIAEQQSSTIAAFFGLVGLLLIFVTNTHHLMLMAVMDSYSLFPPTGFLSIGDATEVLSRQLADSFRLGVQISSPLMILALTYYIGIGILGRLMPALPVFFFGLPLQVAIQFVAMALVLSGMMMLFLTHFREGMGRFIIP